MTWASDERDVINGIQAVRNAMASITFMSALTGILATLIVPVRERERERGGAAVPSPVSRCRRRFVLVFSLRVVARLTLDFILPPKNANKQNDTKTTTNRSCWTLSRPTASSSSP
jgi:hypothetical protein